MNCFTHQNKNAISLCSNCVKGICSDCSEVVDDYYLCCKNEYCKTNFSEARATMERSKKIYGIGKYKTNKPPITGLLHIVMGVIFSFPAIYSLSKGKSITDVLFLMSMGSVFTIYGLYLSFRRNKLNC